MASEGVAPEESRSLGKGNRAKQASEAPQSKGAKPGEASERSPQAKHRRREQQDSSQGKTDEDRTAKDRGRRRASEEAQPEG